MPPACRACSNGLQATVQRKALRQRQLRKGTHLQILRRRGPLPLLLRPQALRLQTAPGKPSLSLDNPSLTSSKLTLNPRISGHWQWILAVIILALAIIVGWIIACLLRRRYLRKKEREYELRPPVAPWANGAPAHPVAGVGAAPGPYPPTNRTVRKGKDKENTEGGGFVGSPLASPRSFGGGAEKKEKKWIVKERT
jgi:hypothetical protein